MCDAVAEFFALEEEVVEALFDLLEDIGARAADVFVAQLDHHLGEAGDRSNGMDWIVLARRCRVAAHCCVSSAGSGSSGCSDEPSSSAISAASSMIGIFNSLARSALLPASSPATTNDVFFETELVTVAPARRNRSSACGRVNVFNLPVRTNAFPVRCAEPPLLGSR